MQPYRLLLVAAIAFVVAACQSESSTPISSQNAGAAAGASVAAKSSPAISVDPATLKSCDNVVATVRWDASKAGVSTNGTEIWTGPSDTDTKLFSAGGSAGETKTGPWASPGIHFVLKNKQDGKVLGTTIIGGPACG